MIYIVALIVLTVIAAVLVLLLSVRASVTLELKDELVLFIRLFGVKINIFPKKEQKYKLHKLSKKKIARLEKKAAERQKKLDQRKKERAERRKQRKAEKKKMTRAQRKAARPATSDLIEFFTSTAKLFFSTFFSHLHVKTTRIRIKVGGPDAAQIALRWYGVYASVGVLLNLLDAHSNLHVKNNADICIEPDFLSERIETDLKLTFSMNLFGILCVALKSLFKAIIGWFKIQPTPPAAQERARDTQTSTNDKATQATSI